VFNWELKLGKDCQKKSVFVHWKVKNLYKGGKNKRRPLGCGVLGKKFGENEKVFVG